MSYYAEGRYWASEDAYLAYKREERQRSAAREVDSLRQELRRAQGRMQQADQELQSARADSRRLRELNDLLGAEVEDVRRIQGRMQQAQQRLQQEMDEGFRGLEGQIDDLEAEQQAQLEQMNEQFHAVEREIAEGLAEAERRRARTQDLLRSQIQKLDQKFEQDRNDRTRRAQGALQQADVAIQIAGETLDAQQPRVRTLGLEGESARVRSAMSTGKRLASANTPEAALAASEQACAEAHHLEYLAEQRQAELNTRRTRLKDQVDFLKQRLDDEAIRRYCSDKHELAQATLDKLQQRAETGYQTYDYLQSEGSRDRRVIESMEDIVAEMVTEAPLLRDRFIRREQRLEELLVFLEGVYGPIAAPPELGYLRPNDRTSDRLVECRFATERVQLRIPLNEDKKLQLHGFGHPTNNACTEGFQRVAEQLQSQLIGVRTEHDGRARQQPWHPLPAERSGPGSLDRLERLSKEFI